MKETHRRAGVQATLIFLPRRDREAPREAPTLPRARSGGLGLTGVSRSFTAHGDTFPHLPSLCSPQGSFPRILALLAWFLLVTPEDTVETWDPLMTKVTRGSYNCIPGAHLARQDAVTCLAILSHPRTKFTRQELSPLHRTKPEAGEIIFLRLQSQRMGGLEVEARLARIYNPCSRLANITHTWPRGDPAEV